MSPSDGAIICSSDAICSTHGDCPSYFSVGCDSGVCLAASFNSCIADGIPGKATPGMSSYSDSSDNSYANNGFCVPTADNDSDGTPESMTVCRIACVPDGSSGGCPTAGSTCEAFPGGSSVQAVCSGSID